MTLAIIAVGAVTGAALTIGAWGVRVARTTSDLFVASRAVSPWWNAAAISGEYLSAASFLGIAGLEMKYGASALWLPIGFAGGYLALLLFVAAPLRRYGSYTIADFVEARLADPRLRTLAACVVLLIGGFYLVPQLKGAGLTLGEVTGAPYWIGVLIVAAIVTLNVALGGMRGITYVQAFQYWVKVFAIALPAFVLVAHLGGLPGRAALLGRDLPRAGEQGLVVRVDRARTVTFPEATRFTSAGVARSARAREEVHVARGDLVLPARAAVPVTEGIEARRGEDWARPVAEGGRASPLFVYSLLLATFLGTMGLPHILVRFYTNPDGPAARRTTVRVLGLLGLFYLFPSLYGALGRVLVPELYVTGETDLVVLRLPEAAWPGLGGELLAAVVAAGAFAAFMSTASGLLVSLAGTTSFDLWGRLRRRRGERPAPGRLLPFRIAAVAAMALPAGLALLTRELDISVLVSWAFALAASTFCPMLLLGIWWTRLTARATAIGMVAGALTATGAIVAALVAGSEANDTVLAQPAVFSVPIAFAAMIAVSLAGRPVPGVEVHMRALHAPEGLGLETPLHTRA